jgi:hypothetical protein
MARPITMKALDAIVDRGAALQFIGVGNRGKSCDYWIVIALPIDTAEEAYVLVASNSSTIRTLRNKTAVESIVERYPDKVHIQTLLLPLAASVEQPEDVYLMKRDDIEQLDRPPVIRRSPASPDN